MLKINHFFKIKMYPRIPNYIKLGNQSLFDVYHNNRSSEKFLLYPTTARQKDIIRESIPKKKEPEVIISAEKRILPREDPAIRFQIPKKFDPPVSSLENVVEPTKTTERPRIADKKHSDRYRLEKTVDPTTGLTKYVLQSHNETEKGDIIEPFIESEPDTKTFGLEESSSGKMVLKNIPNDDMETTFFDVQQSHSNYIHTNVHQEFSIRSFPKKNNFSMILGTNKEIESEIVLKDILHDCPFINSSTFIEKFSAKLFYHQRQSFPLDLQIQLFFLENKRVRMKKITEINVGMIQSNQGKIISKNIDFLGPSEGFFFICVLKISTAKHLSEGQMNLSYTLTMTHKNTNKEQITTIANINDPIAW